jgi:hypothetical protein
MRGSPTTRPRTIPTEVHTAPFPLVLLLGLAAALAGACAPAGVAAQSAGVGPGDTVRITLADEPQVFEIVRLARDTFVVRGGGADYRLPTDTIRKLELQVGRTRMPNVRSGALLGAAIGLVAGGVAGYSDGQDEDCFFCPSPALFAFYGAIGGATLGAGVGALVGLAAPAKPRWQAISVHRLRLGVVPGVVPGGAPGLRVSLRL